MNDRSDFVEGSQLSQSVSSASDAWRQGALLAAILLFALALRLLFFNGAYGSDDLVYYARAVEIADGIWSNANYNGALRYGFNAPTGLAIALFGRGELATNVWPMTCSLLEIVAVFAFCRRFWGIRAGVIAGLLLATAPLHVAVATRTHADPVVTAFLTGLFVLFFLSEPNRSRVGYFLAGLCAGGVFWTKEAAVVTVFALGVFPLVERRLDRRWFWLVAGGCVALLANMVFMQWLSGDPLHAVRVSAGQVNRNFIGKSEGEDAWWYYLKYLFLSIQHTWMLGFLALTALVWRLRSSDAASSRDRGMRFALVWWLGLLLVLSILPVSLHPLRLVMKQSNYMTLFLAPMAALGGAFACRRSSRQQGLILAIAMIGGVGLAALEQHAYRVFVSNSVAVVQFMRAHPDAVVYGSTNNGNIVRTVALRDRDEALERRFAYLSWVGAVPVFDEKSHATTTGDTYVVLDHETSWWGSGGGTPESVPACWTRIGVLTPAGFGASRWLIDALVAVVRSAPRPMRDVLLPRVNGFASPKSAEVFRVDPSNFRCINR